MTEYKLRCSLLGHEKDVRAVCPAQYPYGGILSGSRDVTTRLWIPNEHNAGFVEGTVMSGHSGFVSCVCCLPPAESHPQGLIATGSHDNIINVYSLESPSPLYQLKGHDDTVCSLAAGKFGTLLSGSWDKTAKVWINKKDVMTLSGHSLAVWCVAVMPESGFMVTGSADKLIKVWRAGKCEHTLSGHEDCVRGLAVINAMEFVSCSNDSSIRRWTVAGHVLQVYYSHMNYVYSIAMIPQTNNFVSVSEDRSLKIWINGECSQTITHPCTSVWSVCVLENGDIVTGSSDGAVRVFTNSPDRVASGDEIKAFTEEVSASKIPTQVGDIHVDKLPGPEILLQPGKKDGATQMVRCGTAVEAHQWSAADQIWTKVGDVVGTSGGSSGGRMLYDGKEYDFVFSVDVEEGKPPLKLPYNMTEDPWYAAQRFITKHNLSQVFLDQVHDFIVENTKSVSMTQLDANQAYRDPYTGATSYTPGSQAVQSQSGSYSDPFTGGGRYVPGGGTSHQANNVPVHGADPFTGGGSYRPADTGTVANRYFPQREIITFSAAKPEAIISKLKEFNKQIPGSLRCVDGDLDMMSQLCQVDKTPTVPMLEYLWRLLNWPQEQVFPAVDILRVAVRNLAVNEHFCSERRGIDLLALISQYLAPESMVQNQMLSLRVLSNISCHPPGERLLLANKDNLVPLVVRLCTSNNKNVQVAASTLLLNAAVLLRSSEDLDSKAEIMRALAASAGNVKDAEARFRVSVGIGTLVWNDESSTALAQSLEISEILSTWSSNTELEKLKDCATDIIKVLNN